VRAALSVRTGRPAAVKIVSKAAMFRTATVLLPPSHGAGRGARNAAYVLGETLTLKRLDNVRAGLCVRVCARVRD
jgi:hypothetical protein